MSAGFSAKFFELDCTKYAFEPLARGKSWNLGLVSGSVLLTADVPEQMRPRREGWGEVSMGAAAASGGAASGVVATTSGYHTLAATTAAFAVLLIPLAGWLLGRRPRDVDEHLGDGCPTGTAAIATGGR